MRRRASGLSAIAVIALAFSVTTAHAQVNSARLEADRGMDLHLFRPAVDSKGILTVNGTDILGHLDFSFGLVLDGGFGILPYQGFVNDEAVSGAEADRHSHLVDSFFTGTLQANLGLFNWVVVGLQLPIQVVNGPNITGPGQYNDPQMGTRVGLGVGGLSYQGIGSLVLHAKLRLTRVEREGIGVAALVHLEFPTGSPSEFSGQTFALWPVVALEWRPVRRIRLALNAGFRLDFTDPATVTVGAHTCPAAMNATMASLMGSCPAENGGPAVAAGGGTDVEAGHLITFGLGAGFRIADPLELAIEAYGTQNVASFNSSGFNLEAIAGLKIFVERNSYLVLGGGIGIPNTFSDGGGYQAADARAMLGFIFEPSIGDRDGDGLKDDFDQCPDEPEDFDNFADEDGCPDPDNDRDGILDVDDECPMVPEDRDGVEDEDGCPEGNEGDRDGDGILDEVDQCPDDPEDRDGFQDEDGCPDPDNDQDGILDSDDLCPNEPEDRDNFEDEDGCPDPDNDQDRILDVNDTCPNDPETYNGFEDEDGCPDRGSVVIEENQIVILEKIYFETDSAVIQQRSYPIVDAVAATLNGNPQIALDRDPGPRRRARERRVQHPSDARPRGVGAGGAGSARREPGAPAQRRLRRALPRRPAPQRRGVGAQPARRVQDHPNRGRAHGRRGRVPRWTRAHPELTSPSEAAEANENMARERFVEVVTNGILSLPQDMKAVLRIVEDPEVDDAGRVLLAGALLHVLSAHNAIPGQRGILAHVDDVLVLRLALERVQKSNPGPMAQHGKDSPELFESVEAGLSVTREFLGDLIQVLDEAVDGCPKLTHQGHDAKECALSEDGSTWLYDTVHEAIVEELELDEDEVARETRNVDRILPHLQSRVAAKKG